MKEFKGSGATLLVDRTKIVIRRHGFLSFITQGSKGDKEIFIRNISAIQLKAPGWTKGFIQFSLSGEKASQGGAFDAVKDENSIMIGDGKQYTAFVEAKRLIQLYIEESSRPATVSTNVSAADEIIKLADLKSKGIISDEEFEAQKRKILKN